MQIADTFTLKDSVSGLTIRVVIGERLNHLHIELSGAPIVTNRDFWFRKDGTFDGTGSSLNSPGLSRT